MRLLPAKAERLWPSSKERHSRTKPSQPFWSGYILYDYNFSNFSGVSCVADVGCGRGAQLGQVVERGCPAVGVDLDGEALAVCARQGLTVVQARAEALPFRTASLSGLICKVVLPYTEETRAIGEFARVLAPQGTAFICSHGLGYYLRCLLAAPGWKERFYGLRTIINTCLYAVLGWRLPWFLGDTVYQTRRRLKRAYRRLGFRLIEDTCSPSFLGLPVFIYQKLERAPWVLDAAHRRSDA
jgi:SAM-dependent methyltransferase